MTLLRYTFQTVLGLAVTVVLLWLLVHRVDSREFALAVSNANILLLFAAAALFLVNIVLRCFRWRFAALNKAGGSITSYLSATVYGYLFLVLLPARLGELARIEIFARRERVSRGLLAGTVVVERLFDGVMILAMAGVGVGAFWLAGTLRLLETDSPISVTALIGVAAVLAGVVLALAGFAARAEFMTLKRWPRLEAFAQSLRAGLRCVGKDRLAMMAAYSVLIWVLELTVFWLILMAVGVTVGVVALLFLVSVASLSMLVPAGPAYIGVWQWTFVYALRPFDVGEVQAVLAATLAQAVTVGMLLLFSSVVFIATKIDFSRLRNQPNA